ncbi:MAG: hypothetical protein Q8R13_05905 [bacterium]|nr:hypothetical protein [bacterium]MDZ4296175.1 hypothetical protein [Patescibacteria group bacterium]
MPYAPIFAQQLIGGDKGYQTSVGFPEIGDVKPGNDLGSFFTYIFNLSLIFAGLAAFIALFAGGVMYMTSGVVDTKNKAKEIIQGALIGILLLLGTWMILNYINPVLTKPALPVFPAIKPVGAPPPPQEGAPCTVDGKCAEGLTCEDRQPGKKSGTCRAPKPVVITPCDQHTTRENCEARQPECYWSPFSPRDVSRGICKQKAAEPFNPDIE